ncbi:MAG TPA: HDOD domain-containing protein [Candidatus Hydrogenedentes bacterium]|nr:HDOD domain-containing protein [Candidatus Hydrogenedentota bacterium]HOS01795.1 HDOD domain-containing protein [Candidatus Hydrogenedentota bacterium]
MSKQYDIETLLDGIITLPSLPHVVERVDELLGDPDRSLGEVGKVIATDPSIALKTLRLVNSAYYGLQNRVTSVEHAVALLGAKVIKNLVLTATVFDTFKTTTSQMLRHSVACGTAMGVLARRHAPPLSVTTEEAFVFGLLHDIGKIIIEEFLPQECAEARALCVAQRMPEYQAERIILGIDHAELGSRLAVKWKLPPAIIEAIAGHHDLAKCQDPSMLGFAATLCIADYICVASGFSASESAIALVPDSLWSAVSFTSLDLPDVLDAFFGSLSSLDELASVAGAEA